MAEARVEVVLLHLAVNLIVVPVIEVEAIDRAHHARAMPPTCAVDIELAGRGVIDQLQELRDLLVARVRLVVHRDVDVVHAESFNRGPLIVGRVVAQVYDGLDAERGEVSVVVLLRLRAAIEARVHLAEVLDLNLRERTCLRLRERGDGQREDSQHGCGEITETGTSHLQNLLPKGKQRGGVVNELRTTVCASLEFYR